MATTKTSVKENEVPMEISSEKATSYAVLKPVLFALAAVIVLGLAALPAYYFYSKYQKAQSMLKNPTVAAREEVNSIISQVGKLMILPSKEQPTVATVTDKSKLKSQPFFAKSENGDKVLLYTASKKAILYRPTINKIIEVSPINIGDVAGASTQAKVKVALLNGTTTPGLANGFEKTLKEKVTNIDIVSKDNAAKRNYTKTLVVDVKGDKKDGAGQLAKVVNGEVSTLPPGEAKPNADFLVIVGTPSASQPEVSPSSSVSPSGGP